MLRPTTPDDLAAILDLVVAAGLFPPDGTEEVASELASSLRGDLGPDQVWAVDDDGGLVAVAYCSPERLTNGTWNLLMIAVHPDRQRQGLGAALVDHVEREISGRSARLLLVETSSLASFDSARQFYRRCGFDEEARLRAFYNEGEDKVIYRKVLGAERSGEPIAPK